MDKVAYITGSSKGIGKALSLLLLDKGYHVVGISRTNNIEHAHFEFWQTDLADLDAVQKINFDIPANEVLLVNNAGVIGDIQAVGDLLNNSIQRVMNVNTVAPQMLSNNFIATFKNQQGNFHIINISSGAGKKPIDAWATYCASKAAIDLFSETIAEELEWRGHQNIKIHSIAPGVVDTNMQTQIRTAKPDEFRHVDNFVALKENGELSIPTEVAQKLFKVIEKPEEFPDVVISVRDF